MMQEEKEEIQKIGKRYIEFVQRINVEKNSLNKSFYVIIRESRNEKEATEISEKIVKENLRENYLKIKECLARCGNHVEEIKEKDEIKSILNSFFYVKNYLNKLQKNKEDE